MLSKNKIKFIHSLELKKARQETGCFVAEGNKLVNDTMRSFDCRLLVATASWLEGHSELKAEEIIEVSSEEIKKASLLKTPQDVIAVYRIPDYSINFECLVERLTIALDMVQDPGNMGTIIRLADWYGIENVFCSLGCVDVYNPKTVQATMGALARVKVCYVDLKDLFEKVKTPVYGTFLNGKDIYKSELTSHGIIVMGNEGKGISENLERYISKRLFIPNYPQGRETTESLNVAVATAVVCAEFRRRMR
ncbi:RNA methyltransferase [uncultured Coprobacter sp.]|jgi:RNA methyltransferase, trmH family|uniref:RNA methyltransferase n=1 Tax=uncultured Coprobacter sp. TaxID=1720550 RepID=UPI0025FF18C0|nr:RNA methyltransferase [uncultured Coprobacter sp.]